MPEGDELLRLALSRPRDALAEADRLIAGGAGPRLQSVAYQARAIVVRDGGRFRDAIRHLRQALRLAQASGDGERVTDVQATLGVTLAMAGRTAEGLAALDAAVASSSGPAAGRALLRRASHLATMGRREQALADLNRAIPLLHRAGDLVWEARARSHRFGVLVNFGEAGRAERDLAVAERLFAAAGQELELAFTVHNRADLAVLAGDLPAALAYLDEAESRYDRLGAYISDLVFDRCKVLIAAGLANEALAMADAGVARLPGRTADKAELLFAAARAAQAAARPEDAAARARAARDLFRAQHREWWAARADFILIQSRYDAGRRDARTRTAAARIADRLDDLHAEEAAAAHMLAGRLATAAGHLAAADRHLARAARLGRRGPAYGLAAGWLARALRARARGDTSAALTACRRGLAAAAAHQQRLGAVELRVHAARHGTELAAMGQRHAVRHNNPGMLLRWSEHWRAGALARTAPPQPDDHELTADLTALRRVMSRLDTARATGAATGPLEQERRRLEATIRSRTRRAAAAGRHPVAGRAQPAGRRAGAADGRVGAGGRGEAMAGGRGEAMAGGRREAMAGGREEAGAGRPADEVLGRLDGRLLVELVEVDGVLHAVTGRGGRARLHEVGAAAAAAREVELARFLLRRLARGRVPGGAEEMLRRAGERLQAAVLGPVAAELDGRPVVIVPPGPLHAVPWGMLPGLREVDWCVVPSAALWLRARELPPQPRRRTVIVVGPGLAGTRAEAERIAAGYRRPVILDGDAATAARVLDAVDGAATAHIAAHGVFRPDNPLFSSLRLADGTLTVYDFGRLRRAPRRLILSSCESGLAAAMPGDELLGMISVLVPLGTTSLLASVGPVNDAATGPLMVDLHAGLRSGATFGAALAHVRARAAGDPVALATAMAFVALGE
ncbi:CHAT domain-containing protein [Dactylosporangium vinaceum]|uniref:CHAT domain-containing protein n=1 Tax=Dactylosporangium vinaceum TaxID=53362 RepID=A0ABV5M3R7_9ACTN|nr:CHAT domain-containing tetratricopeptide repeat protein [Dactylosporangium vinaceum]UAB94472.1 CHAT domain-containing protein [Dactylosporangium vinaceum]